MREIDDIANEYIERIDQLVCDMGDCVSSLNEISVAIKRDMNTLVHVKILEKDIAEDHMTQLLNVWDRLAKALVYDMQVTYNLDAAEFNNLSEELQKAKEALNDRTVKGKKRHKKS